jgi:hypothetical protein
MIFFDKSLSEILGLYCSLLIILIIFADILSSLNSEYYEKGKLVKDRI